jgi:hypothetical protein
MSYSKGSKDFAFNSSGKYRIRVLGLLDESWSDRLGGLHISGEKIDVQKGPITELVGMLRDQAELSGILETLYEMHLTLLSVEKLEDEK